MTDYDQSVLYIDNCISNIEQNLLENYVSNSKFPWCYIDGTIPKNDLNESYGCVVEKGLNPPQFSNFVSINTNSNVVFIQPILNSIVNHYNKSVHVLRCKFNLLLKANDSHYHYPHADIDNFDEEIKTAIYYVNDSDGDTYLFDQFAPHADSNISVHKSFAPKKGSILIFDSRRLHSSSSPVVSDRRMVLNIVFRIPKD